MSCEPPTDNAYTIGLLHSHGYQNGEIAYTLGISIPGVARHLERLGLAKVTKRQALERRKTAAAGLMKGDSLTIEQRAILDLDRRTLAIQGQTAEYFANVRLEAERVFAGELDSLSAELEAAKADVGRLEERLTEQASVSNQQGKTIRLMVDQLSLLMKERRER